MVAKIKEFVQRWIIPITLVCGVLVGMLLGFAFQKRDVQSNGCDDMCRVVCHALDATYDIDGQPVTLQNGRHVYDLGGGQTAVMTAMCYPPVRGQLDAINAPAAAVVLARQAGGGDMAYYVAAAYATDGEVVGSNAVLMANNVDIVGVEIEDGMIWVSVRPCGGDMPVLLQYVWRDGKLHNVG